MKKIVLLAFVSFLLLMMTIVYASNVLAWSNGGYSDDPSNPDYGTHDWIAEHALDWLPEEEKRYIVDNLAAYLYGTELPDNWMAPDGIGDTAKHHIYYWSNGSLQDDASAVRAYEEYNNTLNLLKLGDLANASKTAGIMSHYIVDVAVFGHVMGAGTDWGAEEHHSDYETYVNQRTSSYYAEFNVCLSFDGDLALISAYDAAKEFAYDTTFDVDGDLTCVWMDQNYNWSDPVFKNRCGESLNLAVNYLTDVLHTLYSEAVSVHNIDTGLDYLTIQEAINAPETLNGHTILVDAGTYYEHVTVNKSISLVGEDRDTTIIDGNGTGSVISVTRSNVTITGFTIRNGSNGINLNFPGVGQCRNITICNNLITDMGGCGIWVLSSDSNRIIRNTILNNWVGINLGPSYSNIVSQNIISNNKRKGISSGLLVVIIPFYSGLNLGTDDANKISENLIVDNGCGINITNRSGEIILHNNFVNNTVQAYVLQQYGIKATNIWDNGFEGNYWSDYNGTDFFSGPYRNETGSDGIGDTPYTIDVNNQDNYPLMGMFSDFKATSEYHVQTICNSTISDFQFNGTAICFNVTGEKGTTGFCRICIPRALMNETYKVFANGTEVPHTLLLCSNSTHSYLYFTYNHSTQEVVIIPEFPTWTPMLLILIVFTVAIVIYKRRLFCCS